VTVSQLVAFAHPLDAARDGHATPWLESTDRVSREAQRPASTRVLRPMMRMRAHL
jgi:hypothetical protein